LLQLAAPAFCLRHADELMEIVLHLLAERTRPDNAEIELRVLQHSAAGLLQKARAGVEPSGIRPVVRIGGPDRQILRGEDALAEKDGGAARAAGLEDRGNAADNLERVVRQAIRRGRFAKDFRDPETLGVMFVGIEVERIVFLKDRDAARLVA
jgi:hypothetical protein